MGRATLRRQAGFTLIEMLVVIGIMLLLMGLSIGAMNSRKTDKLLASEQLIADLVRQGRHTARTSGAPVILRLDRTERTIAGVIRTPSWGTTFDGAPTAEESAIADETPAGIGNIDGYAGKGLLIIQPDDSITTFNTISRRNRFSLPSTEGFYISCAVRPPVQGMEWLPLLAITGTDMSVEDSIGGIWLHAVTPLIQDYSALEDTGNNPGLRPPPVHARQFELQGWLGDGGQPIAIVSNLHPLTRPPDWPIASSPSHLTVPPGSTGDPLDGQDFFLPIVGGQWMQVGLLYDGRQLILFHNGRRVGTTAITGSLNSTPGAVEKVVVGTIDFAGSPRPALNTAFDNIRVERLAHSRVSALPYGVALASDTTILCLPDGRIEVNGSSGPNQITVSDTSSQRKAVITVTADGSVTSKIMDATP